jgi:hypothetical protein
MTQSAVSFSLCVMLLAGCGGATSPPTPGGPGTIRLSASGEVLALGGYQFPPANPGDVAFVDGWEVVFDELIVTIDKVSLWKNPDMVPTDQSQVGPKVAELDGPWVVDLHKGGPLPGKGGDGEQAVPFAELDAQNLNGNAPFDPTERYAFGFDLVPATASANNVNLDAQGMTDYVTMQQNGWVVFYAGHATWKGAAATCTSTDPTFDFSTVPTSVSFRLGFKTPTSYVNCQDPDLTGQGLAGEDHPRGVQVQANAQITAQVTVHTDHPLWENYDSDGPPIHFDQLASVAKQQPDGTYLVTLEDTMGENWTAFPTPWRACSSDLTMYAPPDMNKRMDFEPTKLNLYHPQLPGELTSSTGFRDYYDFASHVQSTQGHLNSDGLCAVERHFPSVP